MVYDPESNPVTLTFTDLTGILWNSPTTRSGSLVGNDVYEISRNQFTQANFQVKVTVSDGTNSVDSTKTWDGNYVSNGNTCPFISSP